MRTTMTDIRVINWDHQTKALAQLAEGRPTMLGMDMGTGKSRVAIQWLDTEKCQQVLVLCPKVVLSVWPDQFKMHSERNWYVYAVDPKQSVAKRHDGAVTAMELAKAMERPFALCVNYDACWREPFATWLTSRMWDAGVYDECHRIKSPGGKSSRFAGRLVKRTRRRVGLTGTPMPHSPMDLYAQWRAINPAKFGTSFQRFKSHYAVMGGFEGRQVVDYQHLDELERIAGRDTVVVKKRDVLDLPPVTHEVIPVELSPKTMAAYREFEKELVLELDRGLVTVDNALVKLLRLQQITSGFVKNDDGEIIQLGTEKRDALYDLLEDFPQHEPIVSFARFHQDLDIINRVATDQSRSPAELSGKVNALELWKRNGADVLTTQIRSGGVGIDLTRAAYAVYYSVGYSLGDFEQSLARLDRPGQTRPVTLYHLIAQNTVDVKVYKALRDKQHIVNKVIEGFGGYR